MIRARMDAIAAYERTLLRRAPRRGVVDRRRVGARRDRSRPARRSRADVSFSVHGMCGVSESRPNWRSTVLARAAVTCTHRG